MNVAFNVEGSTRLSLIAAHRDEKDRADLSTHIGFSRVYAAFLGSSRSRQPNQPERESTNDTPTLLQSRVRKGHGQSRSDENRDTIRRENSFNVPEARAWRVGVHRSATVRFGAAP
jgi:hypothetical protein